MAAQTHLVKVGAEVFVPIAGTPLSKLPLTIAARPGGGGTVLVSYVTHERGLSDCLSAPRVAWSKGAISAAAIESVPFPVVGLVLTATTSNASVDLVVA